ncbi:hypothetical protein C7974DRAFT_393673 [Boeremia exigua]|uniref:uncharacterized protein n=1 Tax=Boeremia exigua TaxID=749465 RepID=UPI001E8EE375|nr:uncharacterized protein C7974DRAFT_393673 [Boeremia exigua]KAH6629026.1 hypothetical protein C7974DRAFT_393673 [Boeremia exigua]
MPRFLRRIFSDAHLRFRRAPADTDITPSRRVITKTTERPERRLRARLSQLNLALHPQLDGRAELDTAGSARPLFAPSIASHELEHEYGAGRGEGKGKQKEKEPRRRLSKRHRMPDLNA